MTQDYKHPITPPQDLVRQWWESGGEYEKNQWYYEMAIATRAAQWGWDQREPEIQAVADQELEACCEWIWRETSDEGFVANLRAARRPKPPSLKDVALEWLATAEPILKMQGIDPNNTIRRALEQLDD